MWTTRCLCIRTRHVYYTLYTQAFISQSFLNFCWNVSDHAMVPFSTIGCLQLQGRMVVSTKSLKTKSRLWQRLVLWVLSLTRAQARIKLCFKGNLLFVMFIINEELRTRTWLVTFILGLLIKTSMMVSRQMRHQEWTSNCRCCAGWRWT